MKEYLRRGLVNSSMYHLMTGAGLVLFSVAGKPSPIAAVRVPLCFIPGVHGHSFLTQWRYLLFISMFALELYLVLSPSPSPSPGPSAYTFIDQAPSHTTLLNTLFPKRVAYQHILFLHQIFFFMSVALSRVAPVLFAGLMSVDEGVEGGAVRAMGERIAVLANAVERERKFYVDLVIFGDLFCFVYFARFLGCFCASLPFPSRFVPPFLIVFFLKLMDDYG
jgi:hypothetical protein